MEADTAEMLLQGTQRESINVSSLEFALKRKKLRPKEKGLSPDMGYFQQSKDLGDIGLG